MQSGAWALPVVAVAVAAPAAAASEIEIPLQVSVDPRGDRAYLRPVVSNPGDSTLTITLTITSDIRRQNIRTDFDGVWMPAGQGACVIALGPGESSPTEDSLRITCSWQGEPAGNTHTVVMTASAPGYTAGTWSITLNQ